MNNLPDFLKAYVPPSLLSDLTGYLPTDVLTTITARGRTYWTIYSYIAPLYTQAFSLFATLQSVFVPFLAQIRQSPDVASVLLLGILLFVSLKVLNILRRAVMFWVVLAARITYWSALGGGALWLYTRGAQGALGDLRSGLGYVVGVFWQEYEKAQKTQVGPQKDFKGSAKAPAPGGKWWW